LLSLLLVVAAIIVVDQFDWHSSSSVVLAEGHGMTHTWQDLNQAFIDISKQSRPAVVTVSTDRVLSVRATPFGGDPLLDFFFNHGNQRQAPQQEQFHQRGLGSGIIVSEDGVILTNNHVIDGADSIYVRTFDGERYKATVKGADPKTDIAVIKIDAKGLTAMPIGNSDSLSVGEIVLAVGSPMSENLAYTVTQGIVSAKGRSNVGLADYEDFIQTDAAINPGNSGGPLVNLDGQLIGINTAIVSESGGFQGIGFAVPVNMAMQVMNSLLSEGRVVRGWLGVSIQDVDDAIASAMNLKKPGGALVADVLDDSPAAKAGLEAGDIIQSIDNHAVKTAADLRNAVATSEPGTKVSLSVLRSGDEKTIEVTLGEQPSKGVMASAEGGSSELLGFSVSNVSPDMAQQYGISPDRAGVIVTSIASDSPAYQMGLRQGDLIRSINREPIGSVSDFENITGNLKKGDYVLLQVQRTESTFFIAFEL
jgi:serine protease Do